MVGAETDETDRPAALGGAQEIIVEIDRGWGGMTAPRGSHSVGEVGLNRRRGPTVHLGTVALGLLVMLRPQQHSNPGEHYGFGDSIGESLGSP